MVEELDAGPILLQSVFSLTSRTYIGEVYKFLEKEVPQLFAQVLNGLALRTIEPREQPKDMALSLRCFPRMPEDAYIEWSRPAEDVARLVRASSEPFDGAYTYLDGEKLIVWRAYVYKLPYPYLGVPGHVAEIRRKSGEVVVLTGENCLVLEEVETGLHGRQAAADIIKSTRVRLGLNLDTMLNYMKGAPEA
jgi:methionyl-tRNA formyltransferase